MLHTVLDTAGLPPRERVESWHALIAELLVPNTFRFEGRADFQASMRAAELGGVQVVAPVYTSLRGQRTARLIRSSDPEVYVVALSLRGRQGITQARRQATVDVGDLVLYSSSQPYEVWSDDRGTSASVVAQIPRSLLPLPAGKVDRLLASPFATRHGMGALLAQFLTQLASDTGDAYRPTDGPRLGTVLIDLVTALLAHHLDGDAASQPAHSHPGALFVRMKAFIHRRLADPELSASTVAAAHHVSTRQAQRLFQQHGHGVAAYIRHQRLENARRDLADPAMARIPIHAVARRWGFARPEVFTRAFRHAYGILPSDYRGQRFPAGGGERPR